MQWLNRNQKFNKTVFQKKKPQKWKRTKTKPHKRSFLTVYVICQVDHFALYSLKSSGSSWGGRGEMILAVIGYAICLIQIYVAKPLWFSLYENTFLFLEDKWELPMGSRGTVILLLFGVKKKKKKWTWAWKHFSKKHLGLLLQRLGNGKSLYKLKYSRIIVCG